MKDINDRHNEYTLTTNHPSSSYGVPVLVDISTGIAYGLNDDLSNGYGAEGKVRGIMLDLLSNPSLTDDLIDQLIGVEAFLQIHN